MRRLNARGLDFSRPEASAPLAGVAAIVLLTLLAALGWRQWELELLAEDTAAWEQRREQQRFLREREQRRDQAASPEARKAQALLQAQGDDQTRLRPALLRAIEQAWSPRLGILSLHLEGAGKQARLELAAAELREVFHFVERLNLPSGQGQAQLLRHGLKPGDPNQAVLATVQVVLR
ncbi:hypothetical protein [Chromobacterium haemolyticum]|uniref:Uncharacterized protein n=1 Tax=Chromobacterium haemolyticum TaxID=394935 RepID=A0ABS3GLB6_9NEIS|nr:hypothetical protein [Chromobacterium haemolyticum]MBK0414530.1 hypothetical protein [Chromobacterium haemolyticum]MBO0415836.1 hypothetical protein [Chromobacterium haemolyticum]MBO0499096.1 hypothetical protein [Chromobacterium haemolyticum]MDH0341784.1 hypothetical protein [Chromobacterium haemolyticum]OQS37976.1 hypothetical protein B0T40_07610 [Chromobacterium haemolyticum]